MGKIFYCYSVLLMIPLYFLSVNTVFANQKDSLLLLIEEASDPKKKVDLFNHLAHVHTDTAFEASQKYADIAYQLAIDSDYPLGKAQSLYHKGRSLAMNNQFQASLEFVEKAVLITEKLPDAKKKQAQFTVLQGWINDKLSQFYTAIMLYDKAFNIYTDIRDTTGKSTTLLNIGTIHHRVGDEDTALDYYQKAKKVYEQLDHKGGLVYCNNNIGYVYEQKEEYATALNYYQNALKLAEETSLLRMHSSILANIGVTYLKLGRFEESVASFRKGQAIDLRLKDNRSLAYSKLYVAKIEFLRSKNAAKVTVLKEAYQAGLKFEDIELQRLSAENLSEMYTSLGLFEAALKQNLLATHLQDSIANKDIQLKIKSLEVKKQFDNKQKEIELEKKEALFIVSLANQKKIRNILLVCMIILLLGGLLLYNAYKTTFAVKEQLLIKNSSLQKTEERLAQNNKDLQKHIDLNVELEQFAYIASHDIKAPLRTIASFTGILKRKFYEEAAEREKTCFDFVEKSAKSLNLLVDDLLEFSKSNTKTVNIEQLEFRQLLKEVTQNLDFSITQVNGTITTTDCDFSLNADQIKIKQILQNILSNALKFKDADRVPIINIAVREEDGFFFISVRDNGIGIEEEHFEEVFEKFARLNSQTKFEGSGLGLSICAKYIKKHQGKIWIERNEDVGVTFTFTIKKDLPLSKQALTAGKVSKAIVEGSPYAKPELGRINIQ